MSQSMSSESSEVSRRGFLKVLAGAGVAVGATSASVGSAPAPSAHAATTPARQWAMVIDLRKCDGCEKCTKACQQTHALGKDQKWLNVYKLTSTTGQTSFMPRLCMQCENPPCTRVCPVGATYKNAEGVVLVNQNTCIGCRTCMAACPYEARYFNW